MATIEAEVKLLTKKNQKEYLEKVVFGEINPVGRDEFTAAGQRDYKASAMVEVWGFEYENQTEIEIEGKKMTIYRTNTKTGRTIPGKDQKIYKRLDAWRKKTKSVSGYRA